MQQMVSSAEYARKISATQEEAAMEVARSLDQAFNQGVIYAAKYFFDVYDAAKAKYSDYADAMSFEALDYLFSSCAEVLMEGCKKVEQ